MINVSTLYNAIRSRGANIEWQILNGSNTFGKESLIEGKLTTGLMDNVSVGNCIAAELTLTLWNVTVDTTSPLVLQFKAIGYNVWYTKGTFYIDTLEKNPYTEETYITAYDAMLKTEVGYMTSGVWVNTTDLQVVTTIAQDMGISIDPATETTLSNPSIQLTHAPNIGENGTTDRQMLSYVAILRGGNWIVNSANKLQLVFPFVSPTNTANVDLAVVNFAAEETLTVSKVKLNADRETYYLAPSNITEEEWKALPGYCIEADLPFYSTQALADYILTQYNGKTFLPYQAEGAYVDPKYEVGDGIRFMKDATYYTSVIANQTIDIGLLCPSDLHLKGEEKLDSLYPYLSPRERETLYQFGAIENALEDVETAVEDANYREQIIYISKPSGTNTVAANTTWVTNTTGNQNVWTTTRPVYSSSYPVLFVATQRQSVAQKTSGTTCDCTTPVKDQTTTVIDGGHITTGTIDASQVNVTNINASNITSGTINAININGSTITGSTLESTSSGGSIKIADGSIDFYENATTTGTPFSQLSHVYNSSLNQHAIEWRTTGYTKLINEEGGQWTADFIQFALNPQTPRLMFLIYPDSDGTYARFDTDFVKINGSLSAENGMVCKTPSAYGNVNFQKTTDTSRGLSVSTVTWTNSNQMYFNIFHRANDVNSSYVDQYWLPESGTDNSNHTYNILTTKTGIPSSYDTASSLSDINSKLLAVFNSMSNGEIKYVRINPSQSISPFGGAQFTATIYRMGTGYGAVETISYQNANGAVKHSASIYNGAITGWV